MHYPHRFLLAACSLVAVGATWQRAMAANAYRRMTDAEIKAKITGMEITDEAHFSEQYMRDGTVKIVTMGRRVLGKWLIKEGQLCIDAPRVDDSRCAEVWLSGTKVQLRVPGDQVPFDVIIQKQQPRGWSD